MPQSSAKPQVLIVGAGFGGLSAAQALAKVPVDITVVDRRNFHLFQPLLYQVATAALNPSDVAWPVRSILSRQANTRVLLGEVEGVDTAQRQVRLTDGRQLAYDWLILATGATHNYFGNDRWAPIAPGLKRIDDATMIRRRILLAFERAENTEDPAERRRLMTFAIIGAGPTGVELAGAIAELSKKALASDFHSIDPRDTRIVLIEGAPRMLGAFPESLSEYARQALERLGVEVWLGKQVTECDPEGVTASGERLEASTILWAAGVAASPAARWLGAPADRAGRVQVQPDLSVPGHDHILVIGDTALVLQDGKPIPGVAPAAKQAGAYVAKMIRAAVVGKPKPAPFHYKDFGNLATIGRNLAIIDLGWLRMKGFPAWLLWGVAHIYFLIGTRHRLLVTLQWLFNYFSFSRGARLIVGSDPALDAASTPESHKP
ncbi:MAG: pyridine nucleotide-disulfide oxidoreductase family protein [Nevskia sp.]|nr:pyridine nucleotide-disulfide oxidoreductase family protein [Nevskia sp.]